LHATVKILIGYLSKVVETLRAKNGFFEPNVLVFITLVTSKIPARSHVILNV